MDIEQLSYWLKKYEGHIGVARCSCRASRAALDEAVLMTITAGVSV